jgi:glucosamine-6-phosphate deaminase
LTRSCTADAGPPTAADVDEWTSIPIEDLERRAMIPLTILPTVEDVHQHFAHAMYDELAAAAATGSSISIIVPLGPKAHYAQLARMVNNSRLSLEHVTFFGMDEWLDWQGRPLPADHPCCLAGYFKRNFVDLLERNLRPSADNVIFPSPFDLDGPAGEIERRGGVATTYAGFGFQGHVAFNEPPGSRWSPVTLEQLRSSQTRIVPVSVDTIIAHAVRGFGGDVRRVPPMAVTLGMRELLSARRIRIYADAGTWKQTMLRILLFARPTVDYPVTLVTEHRDAAVVVDAQTAASPSRVW